MGEAIEIFTLPTSDTTRAIERNGLAWAHCNDRRAQIDEAVFVFHVGAVPLDPGARRVKCMMCGARSGEAGGEA